MRLFYNILLLVTLALGVAGCNNTEEENLEQRDDIITYLTTSHSPTLIAWGTYSLENEPKYYFTSGVATFMYISTYYYTDRELNTKITNGSNISITYTLYDFEDITTPDITNVLYSNDPDIIAQLEAYGLNSQYWSSEPKSITVGSGALFGGVESLLASWCYEGDELEFYMTLDQAYGSDVIGLATKEAPVAFYCKVESVN